MKQFFSFLFVLFLLVAPMNAEVKQPFKGTYYNKENNITIAINLYDTVLIAPGYAVLGKLNGYMAGNLYETWFVTSYKIEADKATVEFSNEMGSDSQEILLYFDDQGQLIYEVQGSNVIRRAQNRKWIKIPSKMIFVDKYAKPKEKPQKA